MQKRRYARLLEKEQQFMKKPAKSPSSLHETNEPLIQNSSIFNSMVRDILPNIINNLNPCSFVRLARTCKEMSKICFNNKDIQISCWNRMDKVFFSSSFNNIAYWSRILNGRQSPNEDDCLKKLSRMPFICHVKNLEIWTALNDRCLMTIRNHFSKLPRVIIHCITKIKDVDNWDALIEFIKDFHVEKLRSLPAGVPVEVLTFLTQNVKNVRYDGHVSAELILSATSEHLDLLNAAISMNTFKELVKKFQAGSIGQWTVGLEWPKYSQDGEDPFVEACSEMMETVHVDGIDESDMKPAVIYVGFLCYHYGRKFSLLKSDGSIGIFYIKRKKVVFR